MWKKTRICTIHRHNSERFFILPIASKETETTKHGKKLLQWKLTAFQVKVSPNSVSNRFKSQTFWPKISFLQSSLILSGKLLFSFASWNSDNNAKHVTKNNPTSCLLVERHRLSVSGTQIKQWEQLFFPVYMAVAVWQSGVLSQSSSLLLIKTQHVSSFSANKRTFIALYDTTWPLKLDRVSRKNQIYDCISG